MPLACKALDRAKISAKIWVISIVTISLFILATLVGFLPMVADQLMEEKRAMLANLVRVEMSQVRNCQELAAKGELPQDQARPHALELIRMHRYGEKGEEYFWVNSAEASPVMIMHPTVPTLNGQPLTDAKFNTATSMRHRDAGGKWVVTEIPGGKGNIFQAMAQVAAMSPDGSGYVTYNWPKPLPGGGVTETMFPKESFVMKDAAWGWIVGTGVYVDDVAAQVSKTRLLVMAAALVVALAAAGLTLCIIRGITGPMGRLVGYAQTVAGGRLDAVIEGEYHAELGVLARSVGDMVGTLEAKIDEADQKSAEAASQARKAEEAVALAAEREAQGQELMRRMQEIAKEASGISERLSSSADELSAQVEQVSRGSEVQKERVSETATAMEEMNATVLEVAKNASQASDSSSDARGKALEGARIVAQVVDGIGSIQSVSLTMKADMDTLGRQAEGIGAIMNVISDIADQTNLLALNAAIEAARAGDAGRGFAVVADEVRKLAEKTQTATKEVGEAIRGIQNGTQKNLENVERAVETIGQATGLANQSGDTLQSIVHLVEIATDQVRSIATASEQQSAASEEINRSIEDINRISNETASAMSQSAQAVGELAAQAGTLRALIVRLQPSQA